MIIMRELKTISEATDLKTINEIIVNLENEKEDKSVAKELIIKAFERRNEILNENAVYYPQDNSKNFLVVAAAPESNRNFGADKIAYFKLFNLRATPMIDYIKSQCWRINILFPKYEVHYNSFHNKLDGKEKKQLINILTMPFLNQYTKKKLQNNQIDPDYQDAYNILLKEYTDKGIIFDQKNPMILYNWNMLLYKINKMNSLINNKNAFLLSTPMPDYNLL